MHSRKRSMEILRALCAQVDADDGIDPREDKRRDRSRGRARHRKLDQLCKQAAQTLRLVLAALPEDDLAAIHVREVVPTPEGGCLRAIVEAPPGPEGARAAVAVERHGRHIRMELAAAMNRRRVPDLVFEVVPAGGQGDD